MKFAFRLLRSSNTIYTTSSIPLLLVYLPLLPSLQQQTANTHLGIVPRLVKDVVFMTPDTLTPEQGREAQTFGHLLFGDVLVASFGLTDDELTKL